MSGYPQKLRPATFALHSNIIKKMKKAEAVLAVKFNSSLSAEALINVCNSDLGTFKNVSGLVQKYYIIEESSGALSGIYLFESANDRGAFLSSDVAKGIPATYGVIPETLRIEEYSMALAMNP